MVHIYFYFYSLLRVQKPSSRSRQPSNQRTVALTPTTSLINTNHTNWWPWSPFTQVLYMAQGPGRVIAIWHFSPRRAQYRGDRGRNPGGRGTPFCYETRSFGAKYTPIFWKTLTCEVFEIYPFLRGIRTMMRVMYNMRVRGPGICLKEIVIVRGHPFLLIGYVNSQWESWGHEFGTNLIRVWNLQEQSGISKNYTEVFLVNNM